MIMDTPRSREDVRDDLDAITEQINEGIEKGRYTLSQLQSAMMDKTKQAAAQTDQLVHDYPWSSIGVGVALGVLIGFIIPRK
jgi:ElaB/YqjD/DUF883 family membrane-anchored ribosome-binding protein